MTSLERAREREAIRYYDAWLQSRRGYLSPENISRHYPLQHDADAVNTIHRDEATQKISRDKALLAFAQLGCLRLQAKRGIVTLITTSTAYILAESTQTLSLLSGGQYAEGDELWFGTASIPRSQGISEYALDAPLYTARSLDGREYTAQALVLEDITQDPRFSNRDYAGRGITFYVGVPIISKNGFQIGVFNVTNDISRPGGLNSQELQFMQDIASTIMDHLENIRNDTARHRGERMVLGLGAFTEGHNSLDPDTDHTKPMPNISSESSGTALARSTFKGITITETESQAPKPTPLREEGLSALGQDTVNVNSCNPLQPQSLTSDSVPATNGALKSSKSQEIIADVEAEHSKAPIGLAAGDRSSHSLEYRRTFARAANILRQCTDSDGVMFFDGSSVNVGDAHQGFFGASRTYSNESTTSSDDASCISGASSDDLGASTKGNVSQSTLKHKARSTASRRKSKTKNCELLGFSFRASSTTQTSGMALKESEMRRFLRVYPKGMVMHFTKDGNISSSEEGSARDRASDGALPVHNDKKRVIAEQLIKVIPGARNVVWLPLWDFSLSRWAAGCFIWTSRPGRLLNAQEDLVYIKAFANTIMGEINRLEAIASDHAKTSFVANISHELRSPLHGILGSIEFLQNTAVDAFQASMITTVETCGKTLLDTVNHVLDFSQLSKRSKSGPKRSSRRKSADQPASKLEEVVDLARLIEEVVETVYAGQTFRSTGAFHASEDDEVTMDSSHREQVSIRELAQRTQSKFSGALQVILDVEKLDNWHVRTNPGAIRRIVMNLFGNALKYTEKGLICVSLSSAKSNSRDGPQFGFCVTVTDTGKGMSAEFIKNHAWKPFSQEDSFASGVGLGLSIVRQITNSLGGVTALQSQVEKGTVVSVTVTVSREMPLDESHDIIKTLPQRVRNLKVCILKPDVKKFHGAVADASAQAEDVLTQMISSWFGIDVFTSKRIFGVTADFFLYVEPPPTEYLLEEHGLGTTNINVPFIVITPNAFESAMLRKDTQRLRDVGRTLEIICQPCGPAKFAMAIERCLDQSHSNAALNGTSPRLLESNRSDTIIAVSDANSRLNSTMDVRAVFRSRDQSEAPNRHNSYSQSGLSSPHSDTRRDGPTASMDAQALSEASTDHQAPHSASDDRNSRKSESEGPVLLVDDNEVNLKLLVAFVRKAKYAYETAMDGSEALNMYKEASRDPQRAFRTVILDIQMPVMDGITAGREIRAFELRNRVDRPAVIIALTGLAGESTKTECVKAGMDHFLTKPVKFKDFLKLLHHTNSTTAEH